MSAVALLLATALDHGFRIERSPDGAHLRVHSATGEQLLPPLRDQLQESKDELLAYLGHRERAITMVVATFRRLADAYPAGCPVGGPEWSAAEQVIDGAYLLACETGDFGPIHDALAAYERFALASFSAHAD